MNNFDIRFDTIYSDEKSTRKNAFSLTLLQRDHDIAMGRYVIYPSSTRNELIIIPKYKFDEETAAFEELSEKIFLSLKEKEKDGESKSRFKRSIMSSITKDDERTIKYLRSIISHACIFSITGPKTTIILPYKYIDMLRIESDVMTFVETNANEFIVINPKNAWKYSAPENYNYSDAYNSPKALFNKLKKAI